MGVKHLFTDKDIRVEWEQLPEHQRLLLIRYLTKYDVREAFLAYLCSSKICFCFKKSKNEEYATCMFFCEELIEALQWVWSQEWTNDG